MPNSLFITVGLLALLVVAAASGRWRLVLVPFRIRKSRMTVARLGLGVHDPANVERVDAILSSFLGGFNRMLTAPAPGAAATYCDSLSVLLRPFAHEGLAMGYIPHRLMRYGAEDFETRIVRPRPEYRYLYYVGLGFWAGMRNHAPVRVARMTEGLDPLHRYLCFDGYGFKVAFFDWSKDRDAFRRLDRFEGYARNAAYQGVGRAMMFLFMDEPDRMIEHIRGLGDHAVDAASGVGLAAVFVNPDRLERATEIARLMPAEWQPHVHLGMCFGLKARAINDVEQFERDVARVPHTTGEAIRASIRECDRMELLVRSERTEDAYRLWRQRVTQWLSSHVKYPMRGVRSATTEAEHASVGPTGVSTG